MTTSTPTVRRSRPRVMPDPRMAYPSPTIDELAGLPVLVPNRVVCRLLGVSPKVVRGLRRRGELMPPVREGDRGRVRVTRDSLVAYVRRQGVRC